MKSMPPLAGHPVVALAAEDVVAVLAAADAVVPLRPSMSFSPSRGVDHVVAVGPIDVVVTVVADDRRDLAEALGGAPVWAVGTARTRALRRRDRHGGRTWRCERSCVPL